MKNVDPPIVVKAIQSIKGFERVYNTLKQSIILKGQSQSALKCYTQKIAHICLHFGRLPENISEKEINEYLATLAANPNSLSRSSFKHTVFGLRYYFRNTCQISRSIYLPKIKKKKKLFTILNCSELRLLFKTPSFFKHRIDRIVPLSECMELGLSKYIEEFKPKVYLFNGKGPDGRYSVSGLAWIMRNALIKSGIKKNVSLHSLRHTYATHLLEQGVNIVIIKELLGHAEIYTTMDYLQVARCPNTPPHSPLDTLYADYTPGLSQYSYYNS
jgi:integrase/recombinase XerD